MRHHSKQLVALTQFIPNVLPQLVTLFGRFRVDDVEISVNRVINPEPLGDGSGKYGVGLLVGDKDPYQSAPSR